MKVLIAHPGTQASFQLAAQLEKAGILYEFWTCYAIAECNPVLRILKKVISDKTLKKLNNRVIKNVPGSKLKTIPLLEIKVKFKALKNESEQLIYLRNKTFQELIPDNSIKAADLIIGFDTSSWILAERAHQLGKRFILEQTIAHPIKKEEVYRKIENLYPGWGMQLKPKANYMIDVEAAEQRSANLIIAASSFTRNSLIEQGVDPNKIKIIPLGVDLEQFKSVVKSDKTELRFLYLGTLMARKGLPALLDIWKELSPLDCELWLVGPQEKGSAENIPSMDSIKVFDKVPHAEILKIIHRCDVLVFPSFFEGFGLVILEAMACGLPVITTDATAGPDLIEHGKEGFLYTSFNIKELKEHILYFMENRNAIIDFGVAAKQKAEAYTWDTYRNQYVKTLTDFQC